MGIAAEFSGFCDTHCALTADKGNDRRKKALRYTQYLVFELGSACNLDEEHKGRCPSSDSDRYGSLDTSRELTDAMILQAAREAHAMGFSGRIGFHYYNEPTTQWDRLLALKSEIERRIPGQTFVLWTNGLNLHKLKEAPAAQKPHFKDIVISNYFKKDWSWVAPYCDRLQIGDGLLDGRKRPIRRETDSVCLRPFNEMIFDNFANAHLCCADWQGTTNLGSLYRDSFAEIAARFLHIRSLLTLTTLDSPERPLGIPAICARCRIKESGLANLVPEVTQRLYNELVASKNRTCA